MPARNYVNTARPTSLTSSIGQDDTTIPVVSTTGYPSAPFTISIDRGGANEEVVLVQGKTSNSFTDCVRGYDGTAKQAHLTGVPVEHVAVAIDYTEASDHIYNTSRDDHTQYLNAARLATLPNLGTIVAPYTVPVGGIIPYAGTSSPNTARWLLCNGQAVSRATYATLFALIGTTFGAGDNLSTFNVPDLRGRTIVGLDNMGGASANTILDGQADVLGGRFGTEAVTLSVNHIPSHAHTINHSHGTGSTSSNGSHTHAYALGEVVGTHPVAEGWIERFFQNPPGTAQSVAFENALHAAGAHTHTVSIPAFSGSSGNTGGGQAHANVQPSMAMAYLIRAA